jgi:hypothetical protein
MKVLHSSPRLEHLWQIHFLPAQRAGIYGAGHVHRQRARRALTAMPAAPIAAPGPDAPPPPAHDGPAYWIKMTLKEDGMFTVTNTRNGFAKAYAPKGRTGMN